MDSKNISGYDLALHVLSHERGGVEALLSLSGNDESCWLELKAGMTLLPEDVKRGEKPDDLYWKIAKAVISLMNTSGGVVLIGIEDKTHVAIPLQANDPRHVIEKDGLEAYRRKEIFERIWPDGKSWKYRNETWKIDDAAVTENLIEVKGLKYRDVDIAAILVKPAPVCVRIWKNGEVEQILVRAPGELGKGKSIIGSQKMAEYERTRHIETKFLKSLYEKFNSEVESSSDAAEINRLIADYYAAFEAKVRARQRFDLSCFTPLDASGGEVAEGEDADDFMSPRAVELIESDDWLDDKGETPDEEDDDYESETDDELAIYRENRSGDLLTLMREIPRISVLGEPGGGKTTTLIHFTIQFSRETSDKPVLAVFIPMGQWRSGGSLSALLTKITGLSAGQWSSLIGEQRLRLVIDAVNECPDQFRQAAVLDIINFLQDHPDVPVTISARTDEDLKTLHLPTFTVQPMDEAHQRGYLAKYLNDEARADELMLRLKALSGGAEIAANPMLLRLVVEVVRDGDELPAGRAALYRKWLRQWYSRESGKHRSAGEPLPWTADETFEIFSVLAFRSRMHGYRDVPIETATEILQQYGEECVDKLCQGPVVTADDDYIRFRHETFQEYLCAEYLIRHPDDLPELTTQDYAQWGMPVAYASELCGELPDTLLLAAWRMNSWFGYALNADDRVDKSAVIPLVPDHNRLLFECLLNGGWKLDIPVGAKWYSCNDRNLAYLIATNPQILSRWRRMELQVLAQGNNIYSILCNTLALKSNCQTFEWENAKSYIISLCDDKYVSSKIQEKLVSCCPTPSPFWAGQLVKSGWAVNEDFPVSELIKKGNANTVIKIFRAGLATKEDLANIIPARKIDKWIRWLKPWKAKALIATGLVSKEDFADRIPDWIQSASPHAAKKLIQSGLATKEDFANKIDDWIRSASPRYANTLIKLGFATKRDFYPRGPRRTPFQPMNLIETGTTKMEPAIEDSGEMTLEKACREMESGEAIKEDFTPRVPGWIEAADAAMAQRMIACGLATPEDFGDRFPQLESNSPEFPDDYEVEVKNLESIVEDLGVMTLEKACREMESGEAIKEDFAPHTPGWIEAADAAMAQRMISCGLATTEDFKDRFPQLENNTECTMKQDQIPETRQKYTNSMLTDDAAAAKYSAELAGRRWNMKVCQSTSAFSFFQHDDFPNNVFAYNPKLKSVPEIGSLWSVEVTTAFDKKRERYGFVVASAELIASADDLISASQASPAVTAKTPAVDALDERANFLKISKILHGICGVARESTFLKRCPEHWDISFEFCRSHAEEIKTLVSTLQSLGMTKKVSGPAFRKKRDDLLRLVNSCREFRSIFPNMPVSPPPAAEDAPAANAPCAPPVAEKPAPESDEELIKFVEIAQNLQVMSCAKNEIDFLTKRPEKWYLSFAFCCSHLEDINKLISLLQSLSNSAKLSEGVVKSKRDNLARLVHSHREFESILPNMPVPPPLPPPKPAAAKKAVRQTPSASAKKKPKKTTTISANATPVKVDYDPEINFSRGEATVKTVTKFSKNSSHIRIYIDEAWPGDQAPEYKYIGVISGIVWDGDAPDYKILPKVQTHLRERDDPVLYQKTLKTLFGCTRALPFIFPIAKQQVNSKDYPELLRIALITLLGWILPQDGRQCEVEVFCEGIGSAQMAPGKNSPDELKGIRNALGLTSSRMRRWYFTHFESLRESNKSFEYVPYADALGYLTVPIIKAQIWGSPFNVTQLPGYIPLTDNLLAQLTDLDSDSPRGCAETLFDFAGIYGKTKLFFHVLEQIIERAHDNPEFRDALFERLEEMFQEKQRDTILLSNLCRKLTKEFSLEGFVGYQRQQLIRLLVELQSANHSGAPEAAAECVRQYRQLRNSLIEDNRELCVYTDMNLAVHYNDQFDFAAAAAICRPWENDPAFEFISKRSRGTILSSIGQSYAFSGDCERAYEYFVRALKLFSGPPPLKEEVDQTAVYCALNLLDCRRFTEALKVAESVFKCSIAEAIDRYVDNTDKEYHHHLLVKNFFFNPGAAEHIPAYLDHRSAWQIKPQHPWELIELYRILLLHRVYPKVAKERTVALWKWYAENGGSVFRILEAFARCVIFANCGDADCVRSLPNMLEPVKAQLPFTADICQKLRCAAAGQLSTDEIWQILPFNYK